MAARTNRTSKKGRWKKRWLDAFRREKSVTAACKAANVARSVAYEHKKDDVEFAQEWDAIENETIDLLEKSAMARAIAGHENPVFHEGKPVGSRREYETALTIFMLKKRRPAIYSDKIEDKAQRLEDLKTQMMKLIAEMNELEEKPE